MRYGSNARRGFGRSFLAIAGVIVFGTFAAVLWFAYADVIGFGASGPPPLIKAEVGPIKRVPDDPGGMVISERSPATGIFEEQMEPVRRERILPRQEVPMPLPPPQPPPAGDGAASAPAGPAPPTPPNPPAVVAEQLLAPEPEPAPSTDDAVTTSQVAPLAAREPEPAPGAALPAEEAPPATGSVPMPSPAPRPAAQAAAEPTRGEPSPSVASGPARSAPAASATFRIQLGAFRSENAASQAWSDLQRRNRPVLGDLRPNITTAETSSGTFFRLQAGSLRSRDAAVQTCAQLKAAGNDCFVVGPLP
jgi:hypothetical protein